MEKDRSGNKLHEFYKEKYIGHVMERNFQLSGFYFIDCSMK